MGRYKDMRNKIVELLGTVQVNGSTGIQEIALKNTTEFGGYPAAIVTPAAVESDYFTNQSNRRQYGFTIVLIERLNQNDWESTLNNMLDLVDAVLDVLDQSRDLDGVADFLQAIPMEWEFETGPDSVNLLASIRAIAIRDVDIA